MVSTYLSYRIYSADMTKSLNRLAATKAVSREADYYKENIGKITSVDDLLKNTRVFSYAMKAYGLDDMIYAKAYMRKVLESDLSDGQSFVNKLTDSRFLAFAKAFNFNTDGSVETAATEAQSSADQEAMSDLYSAHRIKQGQAAATEADYFRSRMATITSVDQLVSNDRLFNYALTAYGIDPTIASTTTIKNVLTSDLGDPDSVANKLGTKYQKLAAAFSFQSDGSVASGGTAQTDAQTNNTIFLNYDATDLMASPAAASFRTQYFKSAMANVTTADQLVNDPILYDYVTIAFGLDPIYESAEKIKNVLTSDLSDPSSYANTLSTSYQKLAAAFNFNTDGTLDGGEAAQTTTQQNTTIDGFMASYQTKAATNDKFDSDYYEISIGNISTVDDLIANSKLYDYVLTSFGFDPGTESKSTIRKVLTSDLSDPYSFANLMANSDYRKLAKAFNFDTNGNSQAPQLAQSAQGQQTTMALYNEAVGDVGAEDDTTKAENDYYSVAIDGIKTADDLVADKRLVSFIQTAYGFKDSELSADTLLKVLKSDPQDKDSFVNQAENRKFRDIALAFNFGTDGSVNHTDLNTTQDRQQLNATVDLYLRQTMETQAGDDNEGVRLALYFARKAPTITSAYSILADKALLQVAQTALGLPASMSLADIDLQANMITKKLNIDDLSDPKKLEKFLAKFSALYDVNNASSTTSPILQLFVQ